MAPDRICIYIERTNAQKLLDAFPEILESIARPDQVELRTALRAALASESEEEPIPRSYWREAPCGHPPDPVAMYGRGGEPVCHCGCILDQQDGIEVEEAPGPIVLCSKCGCHVAIPPQPGDRADASTYAQGIAAHSEPLPGEFSGAVQPESGEGEDWEPVVLYRRHRSVKTLMVAGSARLPDLEYRRYIPAPEGGEE